MKTVAITKDYITLGQLLKLTDIIGSGGEAKVFLQHTAVKVNGEAETRRGRKLRPGDVVTVAGFEAIRLVRSEAD